MKIFEWSDSFNIGIERIDQQHRRLVDLINDLNDAMKAGRAQEELRPILDGLADYTKMHFSLEESLFATHHYPGAEGHGKEHAAFIAKLAGFQEAANAHKATVPVTMLMFLTSWLKDHILVQDKAYAPYLKGKGL